MRATALVLAGLLLPLAGCLESNAPTLFHTFHATYSDGSTLDLDGPVQARDRDNVLRPAYRLVGISGPGHRVTVRTYLDGEGTRVRNDDCTADGSQPCQGDDASWQFQGESDYTGVGWQLGLQGITLPGGHNGSREPASVGRSGGVIYILFQGIAADYRPGELAPVRLAHGDRVITRVSYEPGDVLPSIVAWPKLPPPTVTKERRDLPFPGGDKDVWGRGYTDKDAFDALGSLAPDVQDALDHDGCMVLYESQGAEARAGIPVVGTVQTALTPQPVAYHQFVALDKAGQTHTAAIVGQRDALGRISFAKDGSHTLGFSGVPGCLRLGWGTPTVTVGLFLEKVGAFRAINRTADWFSVFWGQNPHGPALVYSLESPFARPATPTFRGFNMDATTGWWTGISYTKDAPGLVDRMGPK